MSRASLYVSFRCKHLFFEASDVIPLIPLAFALCSHVLLSYDFARPITFYTANHSMLFKKLTVLLYLAHGVYFGEIIQEPEHASELEILLRRLGTLHCNRWCKARLFSNSQLDICSLL